MREKKDRLVIDTNLWISYLLGLNFGSLTDSIQNRLIILLFSKELLDEFLVVAVRPKFN
jgi:putative PIN family toxin of toxin-antitoxin system